MLFTKKIEPRCIYCERGTVLEEGKMICLKKGVVPGGYSCRAFRYDPLKRVPPKPAVLELSRLDPEDFKL